MSALSFAILGAKPAPHTAAPAIVFTVRIDYLRTGRVHALVLRSQTQIDARARRYTAAEQKRLYELFGTPGQWDRSVRPVLWAQAATVVPSFDARIDVEVPVACTYDLEVGAAKYLHAVRDGVIPLRFLFTGTMFQVGTEAGTMLVEPVSWDCEALFHMPGQLWQETMDRFFPGGGWIRLGRETLDRLQAFRGRAACITWDDALEQLLDREPAERASA